MPKSGRRQAQKRVSIGFIGIHRFRESRARGVGFKSTADPPTLRSLRSLRPAAFGVGLKTLWLSPPSRWRVAPPGGGEASPLGRWRAWRPTTPLPRHDHPPWIVLPHTSTDNLHPQLPLQADDMSPSPAAHRRAGKGSPQSAGATAPLAGRLTASALPTPRGTKPVPPRPVHRAWFPLPRETRIQHCDRHCHPDRRGGYRGPFFHLQPWSFRCPNHAKKTLSLHQRGRRRAPPAESRANRTKGPPARPTPSRRFATPARGWLWRDGRAAEGV